MRKCTREGKGNKHFYHSMTHSRERSHESCEGEVMSGGGGDPRDQLDTDEAKHV